MLHILPAQRRPVPEDVKRAHYDDMMRRANRRVGFTPVMEADIQELVDAIFDTTPMRFHWGKSIPRDISMNHSCPEMPRDRRPRLLPEDHNHDLDDKDVHEDLPPIPIVRNASTFVDGRGSYVVGDIIVIKPPDNAPALLWLGKVVKLSNREHFGEVMALTLVLDA